MKKIMQSYAFIDILKNPQQPSQYPNYYEKLDIDYELDKIRNGTYTNFYSFFHDIWYMVVKTRDLHLSFSVNGEGNEDYKKLTQLSYILPFEFKFQDNGIFLVPHMNTEAVSDDEATTINDADPILFIRDFGNKFAGLKSPHARYTYAKTVIGQGSLASMPLPKSYLSEKIKVKYEGVDQIA